MENLVTVEESYDFLVCPRYDMSGHRLPYLIKYMCDNLGVDVDFRTPSVRYEEVSLPPPIDNGDFIIFLKENRISFSNKADFRFVRSHGHTGILFSVATGRRGLLRVA